MRLVIVLFMIYTGLIAEQFVKSFNIVVDNKQQLMWQDNEETSLYQENITIGKTYCENLILNSYTDWRIPTIKELQTILDVQEKKIAINKEFQYTKASRYWSSTPVFENKNSFWYVDFSTGEIDYQTQNQKYSIRCVRGLL